MNSRWGMIVIWVDLAIVLVAVGASQLNSDKEIPTTHEVFMLDGKAIQGYDPVAFFKAAKPVKGNDHLTFNYLDAEWKFSSKENLEDFKRDPARYLPQYGGYCAYAISQGNKVATRIETWTIFNDRLYFYASMEAKQQWSDDRETFIEKANRHWPAIKLQAKESFNAER